MDWPAGYYFAQDVFPPPPRLGRRGTSFLEIRNSMPNSKPILITGATGQQGGATARALAGQGFDLRGMTRKPDSPAAKALAGLDVTIVQGDLDNPESLKQALRGVWGVFAVQNTWEEGVEKEEEQGKRLAALAREAGVSHFVYTSVASGHRNTGIPHFENKWRVEGTVRDLGFPSHVILRPVFFMENLALPWFLNGDKLVAAMKPELSLQMIAVRDIGTYAARAFTDAVRLNRREIDLAGDAATMPMAARALSTELGRTVEFVQVPISEVRKTNADVATMLEWLDRVGFNADIPALEKEFGIRSTKLADWARALPGK
jgi:uncharacterized protein YbjT (DUF2867 family)